MIRETGWTVLQLERQPVADVFDLIGHLAADPPAHLILAAVHLERKTKTKLSEATAREQIYELANVLGAAPQPITPALAAQLDEITRLEAAFKKQPPPN